MCASLVLDCVCHWSIVLRAHRYAYMHICLQSDSNTPPSIYIYYICNQTVTPHLGFLSGPQSKCCRPIKLGRAYPGPVGTHLRWSRWHLGKGCTLLPPTKPLHLIEGSQLGDCFDAQLQSQAVRGLLFVEQKSSKPGV